MLTGCCIQGIRAEIAREGGRASWPDRPPFLLIDDIQHKQLFFAQNRPNQALRYRLPGGAHLETHQKLVEVYILNFQFKFFVACRLGRCPGRVFIPQLRVFEDSFNDIGLVLLLDE